MSGTAEKLWPHWRVSLVCSGEVSRKGTFGMKASDDVAMGSRVRGHSSSGSGIDSLALIRLMVGTPSTSCRLENMA